MKKTTAIAIALAISAGASGVGAVSDSLMRGSDTLETLTEEIINVCKAQFPGDTELALLQYVGGGSSNGENYMISGDQDISPMSRYLNKAAACRTGTELTAEGRVVGLDGIGIVSDQSAEGTYCTGDYINCAATSCFDVFDGNDDGSITFRAAAENNGSNQYCFGDTGAANTAWRDALRIVFAGMTKTAGSTAANQDCNSDVRHSLAANWSAMFEGACGAGTAACTRLQHAYRRDDLSGTTDTFLGLLGLPGIASNPFCNGTDTQDLDPVRRPCGANEAVCSLANHSPRMLCTVNADCTANGATNGTCVDPDGTGPTPGRCQEACTTNTNCGPNGVCGADLLCHALACSDQTTAGVVAPVGTARGPDRKGRRTGCWGKGLVQPISVPEFTNPEPADVIYASSACGLGRFGLRQGIRVLVPGGGGAFYHECPDCTDSTAPGQCTAAGQCLTPTTAATATPANSPACLNTFNSRHALMPVASDGRVFNNWLRRQNGAVVVDRETRFYAQVTQESDGATYSKLNPFSPTASVITTTRAPRAAVHRMAAGPQAVGDLVCNSAPSATVQIGCITGASDCSIGFAGREAGNPTLPDGSQWVGLCAANDPAVLTEPTQPAIESLITGIGARYPLARKLYLNSLRGFENLPGTNAHATQEQVLAQLGQCYGSKTVVDTAAANAGFLPAPTPAGYPANTMACESFSETSCNTTMCTSNAHCAVVGGTCNTTTGECEIACTTDAPCTASGRTCNTTAGLCRWAANTDSCTPLSATAPGGN